MDEYPFVRSHSAEVFRGNSDGEMVAVKALTICLSDDPSRLNKVRIPSKPSTLHMCETEHRLAAIQGSHRLETLKPPECPSVLWCFSPGHATMFNFPVDAKRQHPRFRHQEPPHQPIQTGRLSASPIGSLANPRQLVDVCSGLQYLHEQDIIHGDLKGVRNLYFFFLQRACSDHLV